MIVYVYDGTKTTLTIKGIFECSDSTKLSRSTSGEQYSSMTLLGPNANLIRELDVVKIETNFGVFWGFTIEPVVTEVSDVCETTVGLSVDGLLSEYYVIYNQNSLNPTTQSNMYNYLRNGHVDCYGTTVPHTIRAADATTFSGYFAMPDGDLPLGQIMRQLFRQGIKVTTAINNNQLCFKPYRHHVENTKMYEINFDGCIKHDVEFSKDSITAIGVVRNLNGDSMNQSYAFTYYLRNDGTITDSITDVNIVKPIKRQIEHLEAMQNDMVSWRNEAQNILKTQAYQNSIKILVSRDWIQWKTLFRYDDIFQVLGERGTITLRDGEILTANVESITIWSNLVEVTFGMGSARLFDRIYQKIKGV